MTIRSEYHHYVPQFVLRNFVRPHNGIVSESAKFRTGKQGLNVIDLRNDKPAFHQKSVKRTFGQHDMYTDKSAPTYERRRRVEDKLAHLESAASPIFRKIQDARNKGQEDLWLSSSDDFVLRKFVCVMKYRSTAVFQRFNYDRIEDYNASDKAQLQKHMYRMSYKRPLDVWYGNLIEIMDLAIKQDDGWKTLQNRMYPQDAAWAQRVMQPRYLAICTPTLNDEEFVFAEHASCSLTQPDKNDQNKFHSIVDGICLVSPNLAILPENNSLLTLTGNTPRSISRKPKRELASTSANKDRPDTVCLPILKLNGRHVQTVNSAVLDQAHQRSMIVFRSPAAMHLALESYISRSPGQKAVETAEPSYRERLKCIAQALRSTL